MFWISIPKQSGSLSVRFGRRRFRTSVRLCAAHLEQQWLVKPPRAVRKEMRSLTIEEAQKYLEAASRDRLEALFAITLALGLRQGEVLGLTWDSVDLAKGILEVRRQL